MITTPRFYKIILLFNILLFFNSADSILACFSVPDDEDICVSFSKFGILKDIDLDKIHRNLAEKEKSITEKFLERGGNKTNNVVIASLTVLLENQKGQIKIEEFPIGLPKGEISQLKYKVFESTFSLDLNKGQKLNSEYVFDSHIVEIPDLLKHINNLWGTDNKTKKVWVQREDLTEWEKEKIWKQFINFQEEIIPLKEKLKDRMTLATLSINSLPSLSSSLNNFAFLLREQESVGRDGFHQAEVVKRSIFRGNLVEDVKTILERSESIKKSLEESQKVFQGAEKSIKKLYNYFWHSEQRLIYFLTSTQSKAFWDTVSDTLPELDEEMAIKGVFLNFHSRLNFCQTCRRALARACAPDGVLYSTLSNKLNKHHKHPVKRGENFFFKPYGSFRVRYKATLDGIRYWMSYNILKPGRMLEENDLSKSQLISLTRILLGTGDEEDSDYEYFQDLFKKIEVMVGNLEERIQNLESRFNIR
jgi:hypothetical protein